MLQACKADMGKTRARGPDAARKARTPLMSIQIVQMVVRTSPHSDCIHLNLVVVDSGFYTNVGRIGKVKAMSCHILYILYKNKDFFGCC